MNFLYIFDFQGYFLRKKSATNSRRMKTIYEFLKKVADFSLSRCLPIEVIFYRRTNMTFSIRYISEKYLQDVKIITSCQDGIKRKISGIGQFDPYQNENPPYIVLTHIAQDHAVNLHGRRLNIPTVRRSRGFNTVLKKSMDPQERRRNSDIFSEEYSRKLSFTRNFVRLRIVTEF